MNRFPAKTLIVVLLGRRHRLRPSNGASMNDQLSADTLRDVLIASVMADMCASGLIKQIQHLVNRACDADAVTKRRKGKGGAK